MQDALRTDGAVARAAGEHRQERLLAANRPSHSGSAAGSPVLGESAADSRTQSGPRRASAGAEAGRATQQQDAKIIQIRANYSPAAFRPFRAHNSR